MVAPAIAPSPTAAAPTSGPVRAALVWIFRRVIGTYFRAVEVAGELPAADTRGRIFLSNHTNAIVDPILVLTTAPCTIAPVAKSTLWKVPGLRWLLQQTGAVPIARRRDDPGKAKGSNDEVFDKVAAALAAGANILIFPEGVSHNEPRLLELKTGAARMLARAHAQGAPGLTFQAVALEFDERDVFRSRALLVYGPVRGVDELGAEGEALTAAITERGRDDLAELLVEGESWPERLLIARVAEMLGNDAGDRSLAGWNSIGRRVEAARKALRGTDEATVEAIAAAVDRYHARLAEEGLADDQLATAEERAPRFAADLALWLALPLAALGTLLFAAPYQLTRVLAARGAAEMDELSTYKLGVGLLAYPIWAALLLGAGFAWLPLRLASIAAAVVLLSPFAALAWHDAAPRLRRALRLATRRSRLAELRADRAEAMARIEATRIKLGL
jgi:1-acyl-sn-glycerol-3-phosphate acyltransferase